LQACAFLPAEPRILDIGCGTGAQTLTLAGHTDGEIVATDLIPALLADLTDRAAARGLAGRITTREADMASLPFGDGEFDLVWSEGAVYIIGFDAGLQNWRRFVKPGGYLVVSEAAWFRHDPPVELAGFWAENYPGMRSVTANAESASALGWEVVTTFHLPDADWTEGYYGPLRDRLPGFRDRHAGDDDAQAVATMTEREMELFAAYSAFYGYEFYVLRRP
jgi:ubiquinone/menaquinone biosynthesis C-methylase UbiE